MQALDPSGLYGAQAVNDVLLGVRGARQIRFRYDLLDSSRNFIRTLTNVTTGSISYDSTADVKRTATFTLVEDGSSVDYLSNRIKPYVGFVVDDGNTVWWPQGVFLLGAANRHLEASGTVTRQVDGYDQLVDLASNLVATRYSVTAGTNIADAIRTVTAGIPSVVTATTSLAPVTMDWEPGTSRLTILNDLLSTIAFRSAWFDENGILICEPYVSPDGVAPEYQYGTDNRSVTLPGSDETYDLFSVPNQWTLVVSDPDRGALSSTYTNTSPSSPTSTASRGRVISVLNTGEDAADQASLDAAVRRLAFEASQVYRTVSFSTAIMPHHSDSDVLSVTIDGLSSTAKFQEVGWGFDMNVGGTMTHTIQRVVTV